MTVHWDAVSYESIMGEMKEYKVCVLEQCMLGIRIEQDAAFMNVEDFISEHYPECNQQVLEFVILFSLDPLFQVYYWRDSSQLRWLWVNRALMSKSFPNNDPEPSGVVTDLFPYSNYKMYIVVTNNRYEGPASNRIHFSTPEGGRESPSE